MSKNVGVTGVRFQILDPSRGKPTRGAVGRVPEGAAAVPGRRWRARVVEYSKCYTRDHLPLTVQPTELVMRTKVHKPYTKGTRNDTRPQLRWRRTAGGVRVGAT